MKKLLYINIDFMKYKNKAKAQVKSFCDFDINTDIATIINENDYSFFRILSYDKNADDFKMKYNEKMCKAYIFQQGKDTLKNLLQRMFYTLKLILKFKTLLKKYILDQNYNICYIRRIGFFIIFLKPLIKFISKKSIIYYEIPTYPLDLYNSKLVNLSQNIEMLFFNNFIKKYVSYIPVILQNECKLDRKMIPIYNGVDMDKFQDIDFKIPEFKNEIKMIMVAHLLPWHGCDRIINSINNYNGKTKVILDIYSPINNEVIKLKKLVEDKKIKNINFKGEISLDQINKISNKYHIAIGSLGYHRRNGCYDTSIKNKEYCAMGLPFLCSADDLSFKKKYEYIYKVTADDRDFDIEDIISWYKNIRKKDYKKQMWLYASKNLTYNKIYKKVFAKKGI